MGVRQSARDEGGVDRIWNEPVYPILKEADRNPVIRHSSVLLVRTLNLRRWLCSSANPPTLSCVARAPLHEARLSSERAPLRRYNVKRRYRRKCSVAAVGHCLQKSRGILCVELLGCLQGDAIRELQA